MTVRIRRLLASPFRLLGAAGAALLMVGVSPVTSLMIGVAPLSRAAETARTGPSRMRESLRMPELSRMVVDRIEARGADGRRLGTTILPAIVAPGAAPSDRPLLIVFNGGPGAASSWLQLGLLGPLRAVVPDDPATPIPLHPPLAASHDGLGDVADVLFVDPLGTGFSRASADAPDALIHDWRGDGDYITQLIRDWMARHHRENAPVFLVGESYGSERVVAVAKALTDGRIGPLSPVRLAGVALVSQSIVTGGGLARQGNDLGATLTLPTVAATACYERRANPAFQDPDACAARALAWVKELAAARRTGGLGLAATRAHFRARLATITGVPADQLGSDALTFGTEAYGRTVRRDRGLVLGAHDSRFSAPIDAARPWADPSLDTLLPAMTNAARQAARITTGLDKSPIDGTDYVVFDGGIAMRWHKDREVDPCHSLAMVAMLRQTLDRSGARLLIAGGLFDPSGAYGTDRWLAERLALPRGQVDVVSYSGGHMFYLDSHERADFLRRLRAFVIAPGRSPSVSVVERLAGG